MPVSSMSEYLQQSTWVGDFLSGISCVSFGVWVWGVTLAGVGVDMYTVSDSPHPQVFSQFSERKAGDGPGSYK